MKITERAANRAIELLSQEADGDSLCLRISVRRGGCSGFAYDMFFDDQLNDDDIVIHEKEGLKILLDPVAHASLDGETLDFSNGQMGCRFHFGRSIDDNVG